MAQNSLLTLKEVAALYRVHENTVRKWVRAGTLRRVKMPGRLLRFRREDLTRLVTA